MRILAYDESLHKADYENLNREWIERYFEIEAHDLAIFASPKKYIVDQGGYIFMAEHEGGIVGTCSGMLLSPGVYELAKLAVVPAAQGLGIGKALCVRVIEEAQMRGAREVIITTNTKLDTAMKLYEKLGFVTAPESHHDHYKRCNKSLVLPLA